MNIEADINWIKLELDKVRDPFLIEAFKNLLRYRESAVEREMDKMILEAEQEIKDGKVISNSELKNEMESWRK